MAATERPRVELLGEQLPDGREPAGVRHPVLEQRHHAAPRRTALRLPRPVPHQRTRQGHPRRARHTGRSRQGDVRQLRRRRPHRPHHPVGRRVPDDAAARRRQPVRAEHRWTHPGHPQPAGQPQGVVPHVRRAAADRRRMARAARRRSPGSWWPRWHEWLAARSGTTRPSHKRSGQRRASRRWTPRPVATSTCGEGTANVRPRRRAPVAGVGRGRRPADPAHHGARRQHRDVGPARARAPRTEGSRRSPTTPRAPATRRPGSSRCGRTGSRARPPTSSTRSVCPTSTCSASRSVAASRRSSRCATRTESGGSCWPRPCAGSAACPATRSRSACSPRHCATTRRGSCSRPRGWMYGPVSRRRRRPDAPADQRAPFPPSNAVGLRQPALRVGRLDKPAVAASHRRTDARPHRLEGSDRPTDQRAHPRCAHPRSSRPCRARRGPPAADGPRRATAPTSSPASSDQPLM